MSIQQVIKSAQKVYTKQDLINLSQLIERRSKISLNNSKNMADLNAITKSLMMEEAQKYFAKFSPNLNLFGSYSINDPLIIVKQSRYGQYMPDNVIDKIFSFYEDNNIPNENIIPYNNAPTFDVIIDTKKLESAILLHLLYKDKRFYTMPASFTYPDSEKDNIVKFIKQVKEYDNNNISQ